MQAGLYIFVVCLTTAGVMLIRGRQNVLRLQGRNMMFLFERRFRDTAERYSKKIKIKEWLRKRKGERIDKEIYESISFLRNIIALGNGRRVGSDYIIEQLSHKEGFLQPVYIRMLRFLRVGKLEEAVKSFSGEAFTPIALDFGSLLLKWDALDPLELTEILISYQKNIKEVKSTAQRKQDEIISELIYFPVVLNVFIIFVNFIMVGYFMEQQHMFNMLF
ncbi:MAG: hypothetical protein FWD00_05330 [Clostridiales bacterium]|nr:hypothetical protein [Clostridiales bacterium]